MASDPVCGMSVPETPASLQYARGSITYYFCSEQCRRTFIAPEREIRNMIVYTVASFVAGAAIMYLMFIDSPWDHDTTNWYLLALATPIQFVAGWRFYAGLAHAIKARAANMDTLIALGTTTAYLYSFAVTVFPGRWGHDTFYDTSVLIIGFILLGNALEHTMKRRAADAMRALVRLQPATARKLVEGVETDTPVAELVPGDRFTVRPGERVPTDGRILTGDADIDESLLTGESVPVPKHAGDAVIGGSINTNGSLTVEATKVGGDTMLAQIATLVEQAQTGKAPIQRLVDRVSAWFVPAVLLIAAASAAAWYFLGDATIEKSALVFVAVVIIACPCALGLATPAALVVGVGRGAQFGLLVKDVAQLERAAKVDTVLFDKTGTLTEGAPAVTDLRPAAGTSEKELLIAAASIEAGSEHPLAKAIVAHARSQDAAPKTVRDFRNNPGAGVKATLDGATVLAGSPAWLQESGIALGALDGDLQRLRNEGKTVIAVARADRLIGLVALADRVRDGAPKAISHLQRLGLRAVLVSGDNEKTVAAVARKVGIVSTHANVRPEAKAALVETMRAEGRIVAMVGDGVNDAPALAAADVGIAIGSGTDVAREAGGLLLLKNDPRDVPNAIELARRTNRKIWQNLFWAFVYNVALIPVAALGLLDPILAGVAMAFSSVTVVGNSLLLRTYRPALAAHGSVKDRAAPAQAKASRLVVRPAMETHADGSERDPVCGMSVDPARAKYKFQHAGKTYYFCSPGCMKAFSLNPTEFAT